MDFMEFITENNLIIVAALWVVGYLIRNKTKVNNAWIIVILFVLSVGLMILRMPVLSFSNTYNIITQSIFVTGAAVLVNESPKQFKKLFGNTVSNSDVTP